MKYLSSFFALLFLTLSYCYGQDTTALKRKPYRLVIPVDKKTDYVEELKESPYVHPNNTVQIYPGETVNIEITLENGKISSLKAVAENKNPYRTVVLSFMQTVTKGVHETMTLQVKNPFKQQLSYKAFIFLFNQEKWVETDVFPVEPWILGIEIWHDLITSIALGDWALVSK